MSLMLTNMHLLASNLKRCWEQELANYDESMRASFRLPTAYRLWQFCCRSRANSNSNGNTLCKTMRLDATVANQTIYFGTTAIDLERKFEIGTTEYLPPLADRKICPSN